jgi:hypothetical protein
MTTPNDPTERASDVEVHTAKSTDTEAQTPPTLQDEPEVRRRETDPNA